MTDDSKSGSIERFRLLRELRRRLDQLELLSRVSHIITSTVDLELLLNRTADTLRQELGYRLVGLGLVEADRVVLKAISADIEVDLEVGHSQAIGEGVTGEVVRSGRSRLINDVNTVENYVPAAGEMQCEMCTPLIVGDKVVGFLDAESDKPNAFDRHDMMLLETVADHIAQAVENARNLRRINELRQDLSGMIVHDLRNPLTVIRATLELVALHTTDPVEGRPDGRFSPDDVRKYATEALGASDEMLVMISGLLDLQKLEAGQMCLDAQPCDPSSIVREVAARMAIVAKTRAVDLRTEIDALVDDVQLDSSLIVRVLENLTTNALKFTPTGGSVALSVSKASPDVLEEQLPAASAGVQFTVSDTGPGIPEKERDRVFDKFVTLDSRKSNVKYSTGLGLTFCKEAVLAHGGQIWVEAAPAGGTSFHVLLPTLSAA